MNGLRLSLLIIGVIIIGAIFLWDRRRRIEARKDDEWALPDPVDEMGPDAFTTVSDPDDLLSDEGMIAISRNDELDLDRIEPLRGLRDEEPQESVTEPAVDKHPESAIEQPKVEQAPAQPKTPQQKESVLILSVIGRDGYEFEGTAIFKAAESAGLYYGEHKVFHLYPSSDDEKKIAIFSMANILEPGNFDKEKMASIRTPGVALFLQLPGPWDGAAAFERMVNTGRNLAEQLGGNLCDGQRKPLSDKQLDEMREQAAAYKVNG